MANVLTEWLAARYPEAGPHEFYRDLFPEGCLADSTSGKLRTKGTYDGILVRVVTGDDGVPRAERHLVLDDLWAVDAAAAVDGVRPGTTTLVSPLSYAGRRPLLSKAHELFSVTFDLDGVLGVDGIEELFHQFDTRWFDDGRTIAPKPTYVVSSGSGLHLYYMLDEPLRMWPNVCERMRLLRDALTKWLWNHYVTGLSNEPQLESVVQSFRMVGTLGKDDRQVVRAFRTGGRVSIDYLNAWVPEEARVTPEMRRAAHTLEEARVLWPDWDPDWRAKAAAPPTQATKWHVKRDLYDWWCHRAMPVAVHDGNRYWCLFVATSYATKCDVGYEELEAWAYGQLPHLDSLTRDERNHFTAEDVEAALSIYRNPITCKLRRDKVVEKTGYLMPANKRNGRKQALHLRMARSNLEILNADAGHALQGRPKGSGTKADVIRQFAMDHPGMSNRKIAEALGVSRNTVNKWLRDGRAELLPHAAVRARAVGLSIR